MYLGSTSAMLLLPALVASTGPAAVPVLVGGMGLGWLAAWIAVGSDGPGHDPTASSSPSGLLPLTGDLDSSKDRQRRRPSAAPWGRMLRTPALLAIVINNFTFHYALYILMNWMPTYFSRLLRAELATMGPAKSAPYLAIFAFSIAAGYAGDWLIVRRGLSVATARKIINTAGFAAASVSLLFIPFATSTRWAVTHVAVSLAAVGFARGGFSVNHMDIAPRFAGAVMGVSNTAGTLAGVIGLPVTGWLLEAGGGAANVEGWRNACLVASILCAAGAVVFIVFGRGDRVIG
jgi:ACS family sodium-dependent inorganic phosphate cotransporter